MDFINTIINIQKEVNNVLEPVVTAASLSQTLLNPRYNIESPNIPETSNSQSRRSKQVKEISCIYQTFSHIPNELYYRCWITNKIIPNNEEFKFIGKHQFGKTDADVQAVEFMGCSIAKIPEGLTKQFPNLKILSFFESDLGSLNKYDLTEYKQLKRFTCQDGKIKFLPGDLFEGFDNLEYINFYRNELIIVEPDILNDLEKLKHVDFRQNPNYFTFYSIYPNMDPNSTLEEIKKDLAEKFHSTPKVFKTLKQAEVKNGMLKDLKAYIDNESMKDFKIIIENHEFLVHKFLLVARSPTLAEILKNNPEVENLKLVDISVEIFEIILKFLYTDELPCHDGTNFLLLFAAAGKLKIKELKENAAMELINQIDENNALEILKLSNKYSHEELRQTAFEKIKQKYPEIKFMEWAADTVKLEKAIDIIRQREEADRRMKEEFEKLMNN